MLIALVLIATAATASKPSRDEVCLARVEALIIEASRETGRVAGPSWFVRDWWKARADAAPKPLSREQRDALVRQVEAEATTTPEAAAAARSSCVHQAMDAGAVPGF